MFSSFMSDARTGSAHVSRRPQHPTLWALGASHAQGMRAMARIRQCDDARIGAGKKKALIPTPSWAR
jgi:hypothetical protein